MKDRSGAAMVAAACAAVVVAIGHEPARSAQPVPYLPVPRGAAVILNTGSTNFAGYRVVVQASGSAEYVHGADRRVRRIPTTVADKFFADLRQAMPLSRVHVLACMKSASFGSESYVWWRGERSPDVSCPGSTQADALMQDMTAIISALGLAGGGTTPPPNEPRKPLSSDAPVGASPVRARPT